MLEPDCAFRETHPSGVPTKMGLQGLVTLPQNECPGCVLGPPLPPGGTRVPSSG